MYGPEEVGRLELQHGTLEVAQECGCGLTYRQ